MGLMLAIRDREVHMFLPYNAHTHTHTHTYTHTSHTRTHTHTHTTHTHIHHTHTHTHTQTQTQYITSINTSAVYEWMDEQCAEGRTDGQWDGQTDTPQALCSWCSRSIEGTISLPLGSAPPPCYHHHTDIIEEKSGVDS